MSLPSTSRPSRPNHSILSFFQPKPSPRSAASAPSPSPDASIISSPPPVSSPFSTLAPIEQQQLATSLHPLATIRPITAADIPALRRINNLLLPVPYKESFYQRTTDPRFSGPFSRVISWADTRSASSNTDITATKIVGGIVCKIVPFSWVLSGGRTSEHLSTSTSTDHNVLYIQALAVLAPYRCHGLAASALADVVRTVLRDHAPRGVRHVCAHVWTENDEGMRWYEARGFVREGDVLENYYSLRPASAWIVKRELEQAGGELKQSVRAAAQLADREHEENGHGVDDDTHAQEPPVSTSSSSAPAAPPPLVRGQSYQTMRPATEWNDLPEDMMTASRAHSAGPSTTPQSVRSAVSSAPAYGPSSRSSSTAPGGPGVRKKRDRGYPAAAFGS